MSKTNDEQKLTGVHKDGNFTSREVKIFEENIVKQKDFLEKVKADSAVHNK
jgi:hypothetical protein